VRNAYTILVGKCKGKRQLGRPKRRWEDNIKVYVRYIVCENAVGYCESDNESFGIHKRRKNYSTS